MTVPDNSIVTEWRLDPKGHAEEIRKIVREYKDAERVEKQIDYVEKKLNATRDESAKKLDQEAKSLTALIRQNRAMQQGTDMLVASNNRLAQSNEVRRQRLSMLTSQMEQARAKHAAMLAEMDKKSSFTGRMRAAGGSMVAAVAGGNLLTTAILGVTQAIKEAATESGQLVQAQNIFKGNLESLRAATGGFASDLAIMQASNKMVALGITLTDSEMAKLFESTKKMSVAMNQDLNKSLDDVAIALSRQSVKIADNIGVVMKLEEANKKWADAHGKLVSEMTDSEKRLAFQVEFITQLDAKAAALPPRINTLSDEFKRLTTTIWNNVTAMAAWINKTVTVQGLLEKIDPSLAAEKKRTAELRYEVNQLAKAHAEFADEREQLSQMAGDLPPWLGGGKSVRGGGEVISLMDQMNAGSKAILSTELKNKMTLKEQLDYRQRLAKMKGSAYYGAGAKAKTEIDVPTSVTPATGGFSNFADMISKAKAEGDAIQNLAVTASSISTQFTNASQSVDKFAWSLANMMTDAAGVPEQMGKVRETVVAVSNELIDTGVDAFAQFGAAIWSAADAAIMGSESFEIAILKSLKSVLLAIAQEATVKALLALADYAMSSFTDVSKLTAALMYGAVAIAAGGAGLAVSAGIGAAGGYDSSSSSTATTTTATQTKEYGKAVEDKRPVNINVYINDPLNPSAQYVTKKQMEMSFGKALTVSS